MDSSYPSLFKHQSLLQDYQDLIKETEAKRKRLMKVKQRKQKLINEVRFLRRKLKSFSQNLDEIPYGSKKQSYRTAQVRDYVLPTKTQLEEMNYNITKAAAPRPAVRLLDLNKDFVEADEQEPSGMDSLKRYSVDGSGINDDRMVSSYRDVGISANQVDSRKFSWRDQLSLRV